MALPSAIVRLYGEDGDVVGAFGAVCKADFPTAPNRFEGFGCDDVYYLTGMLNPGFQICCSFRISLVLHLGILPVHVTAHASFCMIEEQEYFPYEFHIVARVRDKDIIVLSFFPDSIIGASHAFILAGEFFDSSFC